MISHMSGYKIFGISVNHLSCINLGSTDHDGTYKRIINVKEGDKIYVNYSQLGYVEIVKI